MRRRQGAWRRPGSPARGTDPAASRGVSRGGSASWLRAGARRLRAFTLRGDAVECPCCGGRFRHFLVAGRPPRWNARCPGCGAFERHRLLWLYLRERTRVLESPARLLAVAPERALERLLRRVPTLTYVSGDLGSPLAMVRFDVGALPLRDGTFDAILCTHVLEHVRDARRAMRELYRVLAPGAWALLQSPIDPTRATTYEDPAIVTPESRERAFGQRDHARVFGRDYGDWLRAAGFDVQVEDFARSLGADAITRHALDVDEDIYRCTRPALVAAGR